MEWVTKESLAVLNREARGNVYCGYQNAVNYDYCSLKIEKNSEYCVAHNKVKQELNIFGSIFSPPGFEQSDFFFPGVSFPKEYRISISNKEIKYDIHFEDAIFNCPIVFNNVIFKKKVNFKRAIFNNNVLFNNCTFEDDVSFGGSIFGNLKELHITSCSFKKLVNFENCIINSDTIFISIVPYSNFSFSDTIVKNTLIFKDIDFSNSISYFRSIISQGLISFVSCNLNNVYFVDCYLGNFEFGQTNFLPANFINCHWSYEYYSRIFNNLKFLKSKNELPGMWDVNNIPQNEEALKNRTLEFYEANLWSEHSKIADHYAKEQKQHRALLQEEKRRIVIAEEKKSWIDVDEIQINNKYNDENMESKKIKDINYLESINRLFKLKMDNQKDYDLANKFYYSEMEMKRLASKDLYNLIFFNIYKWLSGYGNHPLAALRSIFIIFSTISLVLSIIFNNSIHISKLAICDKLLTLLWVLLIFALIYRMLHKEFCIFYHSKQKEVIIFSIIMFLICILFFTAPQINTLSSMFTYLNGILMNSFKLFLGNIFKIPTQEYSFYHLKNASLILELSLIITQYIIRPVLLTLLILSIRRKVQRG